MYCSLIDLNDDEIQTEVTSESQRLVVSSSYQQNNSANHNSSSSSKPPPPSRGMWWGGGGGGGLGALILQVQSAQDYITLPGPTQPIHSSLVMTFVKDMLI